MIYSSSLIEGFKVTLGCLPIQASLLAVLAIGVRPVDIEHEIYWILIGSHAFSLTLVIVNLVQPTAKLYMALQCLNIVAMFGQNIVIIDTVQSFLALRDLANPTEDDIRLQEWCRIEVYLFIALIAACIIFLFVRSFVRH